MPNGLPRRPKPGDDLVDDEQQVVAVADRADAFEPAGRRDDHAADTLHGLGDDGADAVGALARDQRLELVGAREPARRVRLPQLAAVAVRTRDARHLRKLRLVVAMKPREPGQAGRTARRAVVGVPQGDDPDLVGAPAQPPVEPHQTDHALVRLRAARREHHVRQALRRHARDARGQADGRLGREPEQRRRVRERARLRRDGARDLGDARVPPPRSTATTGRRGSAGPRCPTRTRPSRARGAACPRPRRHGRRAEAVHQMIAVEPIEPIGGGSRGHGGHRGRSPRTAQESARRPS